MSAIIITICGIPVLLKMAAALSMTLVNSSILYLIVSCLLRFSKNIHAKHKHIVWFFIICLFILIPVFSMLIPSPQLIQPQSSVKALFSPYLRSNKQIHGIDSPTSAQNIHVIEDYSYKPIKYRTFSNVANNQNASVPWQCVIFIIWITGTTLSFLHVIVGRFGLHAITRRARPDKESLHVSLLQSLCCNMNIGKDVQIYKSEHCLTPFTGFLYKPVIMLPSNTRSWSEDRLRVVLLHELAHIKRKDPVIRVIARFVCAILWFVPPVWIAYNKMQIEEEKACDEAVIETGVKTSEYAGHIVDIARSTQGRILRLMLQNSFSKQSTLEPRIKNILRLRKITDHIRPDVFIRILAVCLVCLFVLHVVNPLSARENNRILKKDTTLEMIYGHWINEWDYNKWKASRTGQYMGKMIIRPNGSIQLLYTPECQELPFIGGNVFYEIENRYLDRDGNHYYEVALWGSITRPTHVIYELWRIDSSASTLEISWDYSQFPSQIDPNRYEYYTFYRK